MKFFDEWKLKRECKKSGRIKEYEEYIEGKKSLARNKLSYQESLKAAEEHFNDIKTRFDKETPEYQDALRRVNRWKYTLNEAALQEKYVRPNNQDDISYRKQIIDYFGNKIQEILGDDPTIRFHGTPIYFTKEILKSGGITSSGARFDNYNNSTDLVDEISATSTATISRTLSYFTDFYAFQHHLPAGCVFVLRASDQEEPELIKDQKMKSFNFFSEPERFLGICTTPENIEMVRGWLEEFGYDKNLAYVYEDFLKVADKLKTPAPSSPENPDDNLNNGSGDIEELMFLLDKEDITEVIDITEVEDMAKVENIEEQKGKTR